VLTPGGRLGISDVISDEGTDPGATAQAEQGIGCTAGTLTEASYRHLLQAAGFTAMSITITSDTADGLRSAVIQAIKPQRQRTRPEDAG
jgi:hypothetical protein